MAFVLEGRTCAEAWENGLRHLVTRGKYVPSVRGAVIEDTDIALCVTEPFAKPRISKHSPLFNQAEGFGHSLLKHPRVIKWEGQINQLDHVVRILKSDPWSRRAVITVWDPREDFSHDNPQGVVAFVFAIRADALHLTSMFRTTDAWMCNWTLAGLPELQRAVLNRLKRSGNKFFKGVRIGTYTQFHTSFHLYLDERRNAVIRLGIG